MVTLMRHTSALLAVGIALATGASVAYVSAAQAVVTNPAPAGRQLTQITGTGVVSGVVVDSATDEAIPGAVVYISASGQRRIGQQSRQITDSRGRFAFVEVPASEQIALSASRAGYIEDEPGPPPGMTFAGDISLPDGGWVSNVRIRMSRLGSIGGEVLDEAGEPVVGVTVRVLALVPIAGRERLAAGPSTKTDDRGRYRVANLRPGRYVVNVPSVQASVPLRTTSAFIAGYTDDRIARLESRGQTPTIPNEQALEADVARVVLGSFPVPPPRVDGEVRAYPPMFHPAATSPAEAGAIDLGPGDHLAQVDVRLVPVRVVPITGRIDGPPEAYAGLTLRLLAAGQEELGVGSETATTLVGGDGAFAFASVPAGRYTLEAPASFNEYQFSMPGAFASPFATPPGNFGSSSFTDDVATGPPGARISSTRFGGGGSMTGRTTVVVGDAPVAGVVLRLQPFGRLDGRIQFEYGLGAEKPAQPPTVGLRAEPVDGSPSLGLPRASPDREDPSRPFSFEGIQPGAYLIRGNAGQWRIKSITVGGRDYTYTPFDFTTTSAFDDVVVTMTNLPTSLGGTVRDAQSAPAIGVRVVVFPVERNQWTQYGLSPPRIRSVLTNNLGGYQIDRLPAGDYFVVAIAASIRDWQGEGAPFFERVAGSARRVSVRWGESATVDVLATEVAR